MAERETFADKVGKHGIPDCDPIDFQIPYWLYQAAQFARGKKPIEEYLLDCIEFQIKFDNSMKTLDAQLSNKYLENYRENRDEQKADSGNTGFDSENKNHEDNRNRGADK